MRRGTRNKVAWALAVGWAFGGSVADSLAAVPNASNAPNEALVVEPVAAVSTATVAATTATAAVQDCLVGYCVTVFDVTARIPFSGLGIRSWCNLCDCWWIVDGRFRRQSWMDCGTRVLGVAIY